MEGYVSESGESLVVFSECRWTGWDGGTCSWPPCDKIRRQLEDDDEAEEQEGGEEIRRKRRRRKRRRGEKIKSRRMVPFLNA